MYSTPFVTKSQAYKTILQNYMMSCKIALIIIIIGKCVRKGLIINLALFSA